MNDRRRRPIALVTLLFVSVAGAALATAADSPAGREAQFTRLVARAGLGSKRRSLEAAFGRTAHGDSLTRVATLYRRASRREPSEESAAILGELDRLRADPEAALATLRQGLSKLPPSLERERQFLVQVAARLPANEQARAELLAGQIRRRPTAGDSPLAIFTAAVAVEQLAALTFDRARVRQVVADAVAARDELNYRRLLLAVLGKTDPQGAALLKQRHGIE